MWRKIIDVYRLYYLNDLFKIKLIFYSLSRMLQFSKFVWGLSYSVWDVFNNFLLIDATDRSKISSDQKRFFIALRLYPLSFFANTSFKNFLKFHLNVPSYCKYIVRYIPIQFMYWAEFQLARTSSTNIRQKRDGTPNEWSPSSKNFYDIGIRKYEFVTKTQFLLKYNIPTSILSCFTNFSSNDISFISCF